jgi:hypothetical protein
MASVSDLVSWMGGCLHSLERVSVLMWRTSDERMEMEAGLGLGVGAGG